MPLLTYANFLTHDLETEYYQPPRNCPKINTMPCSLPPPCLSTHDGNY